MKKTRSQTQTAAGFETWGTSLKRKTRATSYSDVVDKLEERRKVKGSAYYERKRALQKKLIDAKKSAPIDSKVREELAQYGY